ncbi:YbaK/EbsC family protein [Streptomyces sp. SID3212]|uniref:YbaK/EbsC family protein n=1 Tax=Streptomyces sp. SID3212 TaxID=2690259 RepID=UPI0013720A9C|nr:YbaK/EbsC family protein [Streptomyces sp. SID3212]MYV57063.1 YbaK/EbsC family protein [Streptomyces sp. SID3212]
MNERDTTAAPTTAPHPPGPNTAAPAPAAAPATAAHPRFAEALRELGLGHLAGEIRRFPDATRTAAEAAAAVGCALDEIVKSLVFEADGVPVLVLMDGASRVDLERVRQELGAAAVTRANADRVRETTGYAIGGIPPFGHRTKTTVLADRGLLDHAVVWAAAGTPHTVFPMDPASLVAHAGGTLVDVRERKA